MKVIHTLRRQMSTFNVVNAVLLTLPLLFLLTMGYRRRWVAEDAFISLRAVDNLLSGYGPVFNVGERVEVYTHPLWVAILAAWGAAGLRLEHGAVYLGLLLSAIGLITAQLGALRLLRYVQGGTPDDGREIVVPLGAIVFVAIPVVWDFVTSGLETSLSFAWLGVSFWLLVRRAVAVQPSRRHAFLAALVFGTGPLVRPDLGIFAVVFLAALLVCELIGQPRRGSVSHGLWLILGFGLVPGLYQVFRMGYFGAIVPNTALAKEAGMSNWYQGWLYLSDFVGTYALWIPLVLLAVPWLVLLGRLVRGRCRAAFVLAAPVVAALLHALYVIRLGGDFMHGRFLLPTLFAMLLPLAAVPLRVPDVQRWRPIAVAAVILPVMTWALVCAASLRWSSDTLVAEPTIYDERVFYVERSGRAHPVTIEDYRDLEAGWAQHGFELRAWADGYPRVLITQVGTSPLDPGVDERAGLVVAVGNIGVRGYAAGGDVLMVDIQGLGDALASRMRVEERGRPGHEKLMPAEWTQARYGLVSVMAPTEELRAAVDVLQCGDVARLIDAVEAPLTIHQFSSNVRNSWRLTQLRIDSNPVVAREVLCAG